MAERVGRAEGTVRGWVKAGRVKSKKVKGRVLVRWADAERLARALDTVSRGRPPRQRTKAALADDPAIPLVEFAERAGLNQRSVQRMRQRGEIHRYTEGELAKLLERRESGDAGEVNPATASAEQLEGAALADIRRAKEYQTWRLAKVRADREEGKVYDAEAVETKVRTMATATRGAFEQLYLVLPQRLANKSAAQIRDALARFVQEQIERLDDVAAMEVDDATS